MPIPIKELVTTGQYLGPKPPKIRNSSDKLLEYLQAHPDQAFTATELQKKVGGHYLKIIGWKNELEGRGLLKLYRVGSYVYFYLKENSHYEQQEDT